MGGESLGKRIEGQTEHVIEIVKDAVDDSGAIGNGEFAGADVIDEIWARMSGAAIGHNTHLGDFVAGVIGREVSKVSHDLGTHQTRDGSALGGDIDMSATARWETRL